MRIHPQSDLIAFERGEARYVFHPTGDERVFSHGADMVSGLVTTCLDGSPSGLVLRVLHGDARTPYPLTGKSAEGELLVGEAGLCMRSAHEGIWTETVFLPGQTGWVWLVRLRGEGKRVDLLYGQDVGVAERGAQRTNELYTAQYLAHQVIAGEHGPMIASRQNLPQQGRRPCLWQGMLLGRVYAYATDGTQFFGLGYRLTRVPEAWSGTLKSQRLQGECAYIALQTQEFELSGEAEMAFFGCYQSDHPQTVREDEQPDLSELTSLLDTYRAGGIAWRHVPRPKSLLGTPLHARKLTPQAWDVLYPQRELEELEGDELLSFFLPDHTHVAAREKELRVRRPHGTILTTLFDERHCPNGLLTSTAMMAGNFAAQTAVGNTSLHKLTSVNRCLYDFLPTGGTRIYVKREGRFCALGIPTAFEMGPNDARWLYELADDRLMVTAYTLAQSPRLCIRCDSVKQRRYPMLLSMQLVLGEHEQDRPFECELKDGATLVRMDSSAPCAYPQLFYKIEADAPHTWSDDRVFFADGKTRNPSLLTLDFGTCSGFLVTVTGCLEGEVAPADTDYAANRAAYEKRYDDFLRGFHLTIPRNPRLALRLTHTVWWYLHNAMVHYCAPHGLEQTGGAAWGTRDVCQGPLELFMVTGHDALARETLLAVFAHQRREDARWPQWFMFDRYRGIYADECHGDIIFWPLKALAEYLNVTGDEGILDEKVIYLEENADAETLRTHVSRTAQAIEARFIPGMDLITYAGGDWDDTLQPASEEMKRETVSTWTQQLAFEVTSKLGKALAQADEPLSGELLRLAARIRRGYALLVKDGVPAGFVRVGKDHRLTYLIHPSDATTGLHYRLLPLTRAILSGLADAEQGRAYAALIERYLSFPDGVRLLDRPTHYTGGNCRVFKRAEQAANVGREIGLQYVHAHIRYVQAMAVLGEFDRAWDALARVTPPLLQQSVPCAALRQSNMYFSSSDASFPDRESFEAGFDRLRTGDVICESGWRLYSSGPGIYIARLLGDLLGLRMRHGVPDVVTPALPAFADGMTVRLTTDGVETEILYRKTEDGFQTKRRILHKTQ